MIITLLISLLFGNLQPIQDIDKVIWKKDSLLNWNNFKGAIPYGNPKAAVSSCSVSIDKKVESSNYIISKETYFRKSKSWTKKEKQSDYLLNHEQRHFDIAEIHGRLFVQKFKEKKLNSNTEANNYFDELIKQIGNDLSEMHKIYDKETNHSLNKKAQGNWDIKIDSLLFSLEEYDGNTFYIKKNKQ